MDSSAPQTFAEEDLLPLSALQHLVYCERRAALVHIEGAWAESVATVLGAHMHERADEPSSELRGDLLTVRGLALRSLRLGLSGKADVVEFHRVPVGEEGEPALQTCPLPGRRGLWRPLPVEYKRGRLRREAGYLVQLCAQAICLEEALGVEIAAGAIYFGENRRRMDVAFNAPLRAETEQAAARLHALFREGRTPPPVFGPKCKECSLLELCQPRPLQQQPRASSYLAAALRQVGEEEEKEETGA